MVGLGARPEASNVAISNRTNISTYELRLKVELEYPETQEHLRLVFRLDSDIPGPMIVRLPIDSPQTLLTAECVHSSIVEGKDVPHGHFHLTALKPKFDQAADRVDWR